ncbi:MAG TPA: zinc-binding alcohol dehydrogenase family protein [Nocardioidaceae bacterium]|jgi:NADPH:quinone reductase-like Zn-dependent oxidoreductase
MHAAVLHTPGEPVTYADHPDPVQAAGQTLIRVKAAPVVPLDLLCASGTSYFGRPQVPYVPGVQGVGVVAASESIPGGSRVFFATEAGKQPGDGGMAELCAVPDGDVIPVTADVDDAALAALGLSAVAAWMILTWRARLREGERVLVLGAGGAVGQAAIGAARLLGARRVVAVCRSSAADQRAREAGADEVVRLTDDVDRLTEQFRDAVDGAVDVVVDPVFGVAATAASRVLANGGRLVNLGGASGDTAPFSSSVLRSRSAGVLGYTNDALSVEQRREAFDAVVSHAAAGRMHVAHETWPLADAENAWTLQASGRASGRLVLIP